MDFPITACADNIIIYLSLECLMCLLVSVLRCQVFVAEDPTVFNVQPNTNNDMQITVYTSSPGSDWFSLARIGL